MAQFMQPMQVFSLTIATAIRPQPGVEQLAQTLSISYDENGFINEAHPKLRPVETNTAGVFVAGACQAPRDIPDSVAMASAAGAKVMSLFSADELEREPAVAVVNENTCIGCMNCANVCAYGAIEQREICTVDGQVCARVGAPVAHEGDDLGLEGGSVGHGDHTKSRALMAAYSCS